LLQVVVQVLACLRGHLPVGHPGFQVPDERGSRGRGRALACRAGGGCLALLWCG
jgi:hypothetical protein